MAHFKAKSTSFLRVASASALLLALLATPASGAQHHAFAESFGAPGSGAGQLSLAFPGLNGEQTPTSAGSAIAVNDETGDIYVADSANHRVSEFDPAKPEAERFVRAFGADVGGAGIDVCSTSCVAGTPGSSPGQLTTPTFIAVDNSAGPSHGDVYVADTAGTEQRVTKFDAEGKLITGWGAGGQLDGSSATGGPFKEIEGIDVDPAGNLWVRGGGGGSVLFEFSQAGAFEKEWSTGLGRQPTGIAVDGAEAEHLYLLDGFPQADRFTIAGTREGVVLSAAHFFTDIATNKHTHDLFAEQEGASIADVSPQCDPSENLCTPMQVFGEGELKKAAGIGVDSAAGGGTVYAASSETDQVAVFPVTLEGITEAATAVTATSATLHGKVDPRGSKVIHCRFQYGPTESYGQESPCMVGNEEVGSKENPIKAATEVHAGISDLNGGASYHFRLRLGNEAKEFLSSEDETFSTPAIAVVAEVKAELGAGEATLSAMVNPEGVPGTSCELQWGTTSAYSEPPVPCEPASPSGSSPLEVRAHLSGLSAGATYHFNFSVKDENGTTRPVDHSFVFEPVRSSEECANEALREANDSTALPDCRAYELVTPMGKNGALIGALLFNNIPPQIAADGQRVIAPSIQCFAGASSCVGTRIAEGEPFQFKRTAEGWATQALALPASVYETSSAWGFSAESGAVLFGAPNQPQGSQDDWYVRAEGGALTSLGPVWGPGFGLNQFGIEPILSTADFSHVLYHTEVPTWPFDGGEGHVNSLYQYPGVEGSQSEPQLVAVSGGAGSHDLIGRCGASVGGEETFAESYGTLSEDGRTSYFQVVPCKAGGTGANAGREVPALELFARIDSEGPQARTVAISEPAALSPAQADPECKSSECKANTSDPHNFRDAEFEGASSDGTIAYFSSTQQLTDQASEDQNASDSARSGHCSQTKGANGCNLYLFENPQQSPLSGTHLLDVSAGDSSGIGPEVQGMLALSSDGSHAYFVAKGVLSEGANAEGDRAVEGANNLYLYERDGAHPQGQLTFIARLSGADSASWSHGIDTANTSPDGRFLVFESARGLSADARIQGPAQIYRYDALTNELQRISFGRAGFNDDGNGGGAGANAEVAPVRNTTVFRSGPARPDPSMADDGTRVFFQSPVALVPGALDEVAVGGGKLAQNVYEWEAQGSGGCGESEGCIYLISDGKDRAESGKTVGNAVELLGSDASGENVFFATTDRLTPADSDTQRDYYDARVDGGFPLSSAPIPCEGEACHPSTSAPPLFGALGSFTFQGPGNPPTSVRIEKPSVKSPGRAELLAKALKLCKQKRARKKRLGCERAAHKRYGAKAKQGSTKRKGKDSKSQVHRRRK